ncbi:type IV toxin-antitoxin system AbiEi family antitoxin domain-containing protein [Frigoribacterium sp. PhB24]|uniref:type IV toxin-antitoxin system AbiEi family antitoxin domain-containing protein n=1 Tax=Frigoribacterium sp. PhB24 TaxID=2485204 RepID=UPI000F4814C7|nr:type IV toxin-antitoxin system AbiEi family antitoxin domain-containing protein [Frigoribacterium sp. PhB24]ROS51438.1 hypothetical protein EDF50_1750 [Frigoribacterium sp. PhB24]
MNPFDVSLSTTAQLSRRGVDRNAQHRLTTAGVLVRITPGVYVDASDWALLDDRERFVTRVRGVALSRPTPLLISHRTAAVLHGLPLVGGLPSRVDSLRSTVNGGRSETTISAHRTSHLPQVGQVNDLRVTTVSRTVVDVALSSPLVVSVPMADHALRLGQTTHQTLHHELDARQHHPGARRAAAALGLSTPESQSPLESITQVRLHEGGWQRPRQQVRLPLLRGGAAHVDCFWADIDLVLEADGRYKYGPVTGLLSGEELWAEKRREDDLREQGFDFRRPTWDRVWRRTEFEAMMRGTRVPRAARG